MIARTIFIILLFCSSVFAGQGMGPGPGVGTSAASCADSSCTGFDICQNFEQTVESCDPCTEDNSESWNKVVGGAGTITVDSTSSPLRGNQSILITAADSTASSIDSPAFTERDTVYAFFRLSLSDGRPSTPSYVFMLQNGGTTVGKLRIMTNGVIYWFNGSSYITSTTTLNDGAVGPYYIYLYWTKDPNTTDTGTMGISVSTNRTFTAWEAEGSNGTSDLAVSSVRFYDRYISGVKIDQVLIKSTSIGTVCE